MFVSMSEKKNQPDKRKLKLLPSEKLFSKVFIDVLRLLKVRSLRVSLFFEFLLPEHGI